MPRSTRKVYAVTLHVSEESLGTVLGTVVGSATVVSVVPTTETAQPVAVVGNLTASAKKEFHYVGGKRNKGISGPDLAIQILNEQPLRVWSLNDIRNKYMERGFAASSAYPNLLLGIKKTPPTVRALGDGKFCSPHMTLRQLTDMGQN